MPDNSFDVSVRTHFGYENYVVMLTAFHTGMRSAELAGLQWSDFDLRGRFLAVRKRGFAGAVNKLPALPSPQAEQARVAGD